MSRKLSIIRFHTTSGLINRFLTTPWFHLNSTRSLETLAFEEVRSSEERPYSLTAFVLHGLLGSGRNWRSFSRTLASSLPEWRMVMVDLRNHGKSAGLGGIVPPHDMKNAAEDLANLVKSQGWKWPDAVIGHSMGGKVALQFAQSCARGDYGESVSLPKQLLSFISSKFVHISSGIILPLHIVLMEKATTGAGQLWILDSVPGKVSPENSDGEVEKVLQTLQTLPSSIPSRKWLVEHLLKLGFSKSLSGWLGTNLKKSGDKETWAFNLEGAIQMFNSYRETDYWPLLKHPPKGLEIVIVRAENSDRWTEDVIQQLQNLASKSIHEDEGKVSYYVLPKSGHWVHVDNPKGLLEFVTPKIASLV